VTAQIHERLIHEGRETTMSFCPELPAHPRIVEVNRDLQPIEERERICYSTACWRRYQGTWEIAGGRFSLVGLIGRYRLLGDGPLFAEWFSGTIRIPRGSMQLYIHMGFGSVYAQELHVRIENGLVAGSRLIDNTGKRFNETKLALDNLPGGENKFPGDDEA
jgi:hypothetical protein